MSAPNTFAPWPIDPQLTAIAIAYKNGRTIADGILPRTTPVAKQEFRYRRYSFQDVTRIPDTRVGRTSKPNQVNFGFTEEAAFTQDHGLDDPISQADLANAPEGYDPRAKATEQLSALMALDREVRVARLVMDAANYGAANKETLAAGSKFTDAGFDPIEFILDKLDGMVMRPNKACMSRKAATKLRTNPWMVKAWHGNTGDAGAVPLKACAELLEMEEILVGESWVDLSKPGQAANLQPVWGDSMLLFHQNGQADVRSGVSFGYTVPWGSKIAGVIEDPDLGLRGGLRVRVGESVKELIVASDLAYLLDAVI